MEFLPLLLSLLGLIESKTTIRAAHVDLPKLVRDLIESWSYKRRRNKGNFVKLFDNEVSKISKLF